MPELDRTSPMPLWAQLESILRERLEDGEFDNGFPTDAALVSRYRVSRHTVREAVRALNADGILQRERGRGTTINRAQFEQKMGSLYSLFRSIEDAGVEQRSEVLDLGIVQHAEAAEHLGLEPDTELVYLQRIRFADGEPLAVDRAWLPRTIAEPILEADFSRTALYDELETRCGIRPNHGHERVRPILPGYADRELLQLDRTDAAFFLERLGQVDDEVVEWRTTTIRGDRYHFVADWTAGVPDDGPRLSAS